MVCRSYHNIPHDATLSPTSSLLTHQLIQKRSPTILSPSWWECNTFLTMGLHPLHFFRHVSYATTLPLSQWDCSPKTGHSSNSSSLFPMLHVLVYTHFRETTSYADFPLPRWKFSFQFVQHFGKDIFGPLFQVDLVSYMQFLVFKNCCVVIETESFIANASSAAIWPPGLSSSL